MTKSPIIKPMIKPGLKILLVTIVLMSTGCNKNQRETDNKSNSSSSSSSSSPHFSNDKVLIAALVNNYSNMLQKKLDASTLAALFFKESVDTFLAEPDNINLEKTKQKWRENYLSYNQTSPFRILQNQSDRNKSIGNTIDSWPIMPGYIDAIPGFPNSGIVNDITLILDEKNLRSQHGLTSPAEVSIGFHAIEFLLWGDSAAQNIPPVAKKTNSSKNLLPERDNSKTISRFLPVKNWDQTELNISQHSNNRRRKYMSLSATILLNDIESTHKKAKDVWHQNPDAGQVFHALYMSLVEIRKQLSEFNEISYISSSFSGAIHKDLILHTHLIVELLKPLELHKQTDTGNTIQNLSLIIVNIEKALEEPGSSPEENGIWDRLDFNLSQLESFLFTTSNDFNPGHFTKYPDQTIK